MRILLNSVSCGCYVFNCHKDLVLLTHDKYFLSSVLLVGKFAIKHDIDIK